MLYKRTGTHWDGLGHTGTDWDRWGEDVQWTIGTWKTKLKDVKTTRCKSAGGFSKQLLKKNCLILLLSDNTDKIKWINCFYDRRFMEMSRT